MVIGLISDTHGSLSDLAVNALNGVEHIIHAGDIGSADIARKLKKIAPTTMVRGNTDKAAWAQALPATEMLSLNGCVIYVLHNLELMDIDPPSAGINLLISGHTHQPSIRNHQGVLYINPGSASIGRYGGPVSIAKTIIEKNKVRPEIIVLEN